MSGPSPRPAGPSASVAGPVSRLAGRVADAFDRIDQFSAYLAAVGLTVMSGIVVLEVLLRFFFTVSTLVADEIAAYMLATVSFCALGYALRTEGHIRIELLYALIPAPIRKWVELVFVVVAIVVTTIFASWLYRMVAQSYVLKVDSQSQIETPLWIPQSVLVYGTIVLILALISRLVRILRNEVRP